MPHTHIHLHEADENDPRPAETPSKSADPLEEKPAAQQNPPAGQPPAQMSPQAAKTAARRLGRTMKIDPQEGLRDVAKYFGAELASRFTKIAEMMGLDEALADLEDHVAGLAEKKPMPGLGEAVRRTQPGSQPMPAARDAGTFVGARKTAAARKRIGGAGYRIRSARPTKKQWVKFQARSK